MSDHVNGDFYDGERTPPQLEVLIRQDRPLLPFGFSRPVIYRPPQRRSRTRDTSVPARVIR